MADDVEGERSLASTFSHHSSSSQPRRDYPCVTTRINFLQEPGLRLTERSLLLPCLPSVVLDICETICIRTPTPVFGLHNRNGHGRDLWLILGVEAAPIPVYRLCRTHDGIEAFGGRIWAGPGSELGGVGNVGKEHRTVVRHELRGRQLGELRVCLLAGFPRDARARDNIARGCWAAATDEAPSSEVWGHVGAPIVVDALRMPQQAHVRVEAGVHVLACLRDDLPASGSNVQGVELSVHLLPVQARARAGHGRDSQPAQREQNRAEAWHHIDGAKKRFSAGWQGLMSGAP